MFKLLCIFRLAKEIDILTKKGTTDTNFMKLAEVAFYYLYFSLLHLTSEFISFCFSFNSALKTTRKSRMITSKSGNESANKQNHKD